MEIKLKVLDTEKINEATKNIDIMSTLKMLSTINQEDMKIAFAVKECIPSIAKVIDDAYERLKIGGRLIYIGAGTSGRLGILDASECSPTYGVDENLVQGIIAGGKDALFKAKEGAEDSKELCIKDLKQKKLNSKDVVIGLTASGRTPYVIGGLEYANNIGAFTSSICCVKDGQVSKISKIAIETIVGPEVVAGSTRMKSGTAQKMILNMISTSIMIKLGKTYGNLMVDLKASNQKLMERSKNILIECTGVNELDAIKFLKESDGDVKLSIFMILSKLNKEKSEKMLKENNNNIRKALSMLYSNF